MWKLNLLNFHALKNIIKYILKTQKSVLKIFSKIENLQKLFIIQMYTKVFLENGMGEGWCKIVTSTSWIMKISYNKNYINIIYSNNSLQEVFWLCFRKKIITIGEFEISTWYWYSACITCPYLKISKYCYKYYYFLNNGTIWAPILVQINNDIKSTIFFIVLFYLPLFFIKERTI